MGAKLQYKKKGLDLPFPILSFSREKGEVGKKVNDNIEDSHWIVGWYTCTKPVQEHLSTHFLGVLRTESVVT